ncbi:pilus assembly protein CpaD [Altererythrobacter xixiisoli]|uniref:Pilus assembly protein CpaD n=1 Tax=Croceibacterium xixiisoli TaxID=1476466 RepID=A0A6I4TQJ9_9SPHN|nr:CpaD family pilus assembly lipoprotein [Croceibacterium xixiisoli]MXO98146.1 pilus assembly protein CpaD [Croceibacterium xixiisoli]
MLLRHKQAAAAALAISLGLALGACQSGGPAQANRSLNSVHQPVVDHRSFALDVSAGSSGLAAPDKRRLADWFTAMNLGYGDQVAIDGRSVSHATREDIAALVGQHGLRLSDGAAASEGVPPVGAVRVVISRAVASVPSCPNWEGRSANHLGNHTSPNFGCATNSNLAAMVANPDHLIQGARDTGDTAIMTSNKAIDAYRVRPPTGNQALSTTATTGQGN